MPSIGSLHSPKTGLFGRHAEFIGTFVVHEGIECTFLVRFSAIIQFTQIQSEVVLVQKTGSVPCIAAKQARQCCI